MKKIIRSLAILSVVIPSAIMAQLPRQWSADYRGGFGKEVLISQKIVKLKTDINLERIKYTSRGYRQALVKIINPELATHTLLNHRNEGEDGPCLFTVGTSNESDVIQGNPATEQVSYTITQSKDLVIDKANNVCRVTLMENITANIRGFEFNHFLRLPLPDRVVEDCK